MLGFNRSTDLRDGGKSVLKPALYDPPGAQAKTAPGANLPSRAAAPAPAAVRDGRSGAEAVPHDAPVPAAESAVPVLTDVPGSKLFIGVNIKLKGVEVSDCDVLVIEGQVDATVHSKLMQIARPGTLHGTALIDVAEIHGEFAGELTARTRLVVHGTGRVSGTIRYGKLIVAEGGELSGDVKRLDADEQPQRSLLPASSPRQVLAPSAGTGLS
ncbi:MAG TPA: polymer-forming cytoskeletal protein [Casimicrobiaceae bacterium]|jgi:cytoskeletal protein CcmA (bactofilin family)|nr:polymer-forming cytoskeletal protein [Casimicrobiaceae bacterium]